MFIVNTISVKRRFYILILAHQSMHRKYFCILIFSSIWATHLGCSGNVIHADVISRITNILQSNCSAWPLGWFCQILQGKHGKEFSRLLKRYDTGWSVVLRKAFVTKIYFLENIRNDIRSLLSNLSVFSRLVGKSKQSQIEAVLLQEG